MVESAGDAVRHAGELGDLVALAKQREIAITGGSTDALGNFSPVPEEMRGTFEGADPHVISQVVAPLAANLANHAQSILPRNPNNGDKWLQGAGHVAFGLPTLLSPPLAAGYYFTDGYGRTYENALAHGASEDDARISGLGGGAVQGALALAPVPGARFFGEAAAPLASPVARAVARLGATSATSAAYGAASQFADNAIAGATYEPRRSLNDGLATAAVTGGVMGIAGQTVREGAASRWPDSPRTPPETPTISLAAPQQPAETVLQLGGAHKNVKAGIRNNKDYQSHHLPADSASPLSKGEGPAIAMLVPDHKRTASHSRGRRQDAYRAKQAQLIAEGNFAASQQMDIDDIRGLFRNKYDNAIADALKYSQDKGY